MMLSEKNYMKRFCPKNKYPEYLADFFMGDSIHCFVCLYGENIHYQLTNRVGEMLFVVDYKAFEDIYTEDQDVRYIEDEFNSMVGELSFSADRKLFQDVSAIW